MLRVRTVLTASIGAPYLSTMFFFGSSSSEANSAASAVGTFWYNLRGSMNGSLTYTTETDVAQIDPATGTLLDIFVVSPFTGSGTLESEILPPTTQGLISWGTGAIVGGKRLQGRTFIPGATESSNSNGVPDTPYKYNLDNAAVSLLGDIDATLAIWSRKNGTERAVTGGSAAAYWAELRSRRD